jgi:CDP-diacylglycerol--glycerol-3-phosphate 3-phosphatidyltransferase
MRAAPPDHAGDAVGSAPVVNLPNALTVLRVLAVPVLALLMAVDDGQSGPARWAAAALFVAASITDFVDGAIARRYGWVTTFGKVADPIADKALTGVALVGLSLLGDLAWWVTAVILAREIGVTLLRFWVIRHGVIPASRGGKVKTVLQTIAIAMYLVPYAASWWVLASQAAMLLAVAATVVTGIDYIGRALRLRGAARRG